MANRTSAKSNIVTKNVPTVTNAILTDMLNSDMNDNIKFLEDVAVTQSSSVSNITVDFTDKDRIDLTRTGGSLNITVSGIGDGETVFLLITKTTGQAITFTNVTDTTSVTDYVDSASRILYEIVRKSSYYFARAWVDSVKQATTSILGVVELATATEANALTDTIRAITPGTIPQASDTQKGVAERATYAEVAALTDTLRFVTPGRIPRASETQSGVVEWATLAQALAGTDIEGYDALVIRPSVLQSVLKNLQDAPTWLTATKESGWSGSLYYFKDAAGNVHVMSDDVAPSADITGTSKVTLWTIPSAYQPSKTASFVIHSYQSSDEDRRTHVAEFRSNGLFIAPEPDAVYTTYDLRFYLIYKSV